MSSMDVLDHLVAELKRNNVVLFVGAGLSMGSNLPSWIGLMEPLAVELGRNLPPLEFLTGNHLLDVADAFERERGRNALLRYLKDALNQPNIEPNPTHDLLTRLMPLGTFITTNYDSLLERAYRNVKKPYQAVVSDSDLAYWDESKVRIIKLRGDLEQPNSIVITRRDFDTYPLKCPLIHNYLQSLLVVKTMVFLGYSFSDPDLQLLMHQLQYLLGAHMRNAFALLFDLTSEEISICQSKGIQCYVIDSRRLGKTIALRVTVDRLVKMLTS